LPCGYRHFDGLLNNRPTRSQAVARIADHTASQQTI